MAKFTTRVTLHKDEISKEPLGWDEYEILHEEMEEEGFVRTIIDNKTKIEYHLPKAEYNKIGNFTIEQVLSSAENAVNKTGKNYSILVTKGNRYWSGLEKVKK